MAGKLLNFHSEEYPQSNIPIRLPGLLTMYCNVVFSVIQVLREIEGKMCAYLTKSGYKAFNL